jgi:hypothetical protein
MNSGLITVTLISCIARIPSAAGILARAAMTKLEKAKNTPPASPAPTAVPSTRTRSASGMADRPRGEPFVRADPNLVRLAHSDRPLVGRDRGTAAPVISANHRTVLR